MKTEELCSISISSLVTNPFAIQWSSDNQLSIIAEGGVHVFGLQPSPMSPDSTIKFARSFVPSYFSENPPAYAFADKVDSLIWNLDREDNYLSLMEETIAPKLNSINDTVHKIVSTAWSPKNLISPSQCVLAILNAAGSVELSHKTSNQWYSICDVSSLRLKNMQEEIKFNLNKCKKSNRYTVITESMRQLQACSMTWSELFEIEKTSFAYFSVAYRSGDILIWKIPRISDFTKSLEPILVGRIDLNIAIKINVLCWITVNTNEYLLIVGYFDGRICGVKLTYGGNDLQIASIEKYVAPNRIAINYLHVVSQDELIVKILAAKGTFLLLLCINLTGTLKSMEYLQVQGFNISGIIHIAPQRFLVSTQDSQFFIFDIQSNNLIIADIKTHLQQTSVQSLGLAHSPNKVMFINITSPKAMYDHLVMREPSIVHIFTLKDTIYDPLPIINNSANLISVWDCMEVLRLKAIKAEDSTMVLSSIKEKLESLSLYKLQLSLWMSVMINVCSTKKPIPDMNHIQKCKITQALPLILVQSACEYIDNLKKKSTLSENQTHAMSLLRKYLEVYLTAEDEKKEDIVYQRARKILNVTASYPNQIETCNQCGEVIDEFWNVNSCPRGHKWSRCPTTLLQILSEYYVCPICAENFHSCLKEIYEEPRCQFCDVPVLCNFHAFDVKESKLYGKNLSQQRNADTTESSRELDSEEPHENQRKRKWDTSHTYSVIVNDDDDESGRITEKWEEF